MGAVTSDSDQLVEDYGVGFALYHKGREAMDSGDIDSAIAFLRQSAEVEPHFKTLELLGECLLRQKRASEAVIPLAAAVGLGINSRPFRALYFLAQALESIGHSDSALRKLELALE